MSAPPERVELKSKAAYSTTILFETYTDGDVALRSWQASWSTAVDG